MEAELAPGQGDENVRIGSPSRCAAARESDRDRVGRCEGHPRIVVSRSAAPTVIVTVVRATAGAMRPNTTTAMIALRINIRTSMPAPQITDVQRDNASETSVVTSRAARHGLGTLEPADQPRDGDSTRG